MGRRFAPPFWFTIGGILVGVGLPAVAGALTFGLDGATLQLRLGWLFAAAALASLLGLLAIGMGLVGFARRDEASSPPSSEIRYRRFLVGLGFAELVIAVAALVAYAGLTYNCFSEVLFPASADGVALPHIALSAEGAANGAADAAAIEAKKRLLGQAGVLLISAAMAVLGGLFFVTNALHEKREASEEFEETKFWGGLWYRMGEAVLFTLVFYLAIRTYQPGNADAPLWLPVLALLLGMFVKTGERLVFGLARRVFAATTQLLPLEVDDVDAAFRSKAPRTPRELTVNRSADGKTIQAAWQAPDTGPVVRGYVLAVRPAGGSWERHPVDQAAPTTATIPDLDPVTEYEVRVCAVNDAGASGWTFIVRSPG